MIEVNKKPIVHKRDCKKTFVKVVLVFCICIIPLYASGCKPQKKQATASIVGKWKDIDNMRSSPDLVFRTNGTYLVSFQNGRHTYDGTYSLSGSMIRVNDAYCGTKLDGIYEFSVNDTAISFKLVQDQFCDRARFFLDRWVRVQ